MNEEEFNLQEISWERPDFYYGNQKWIPKIFDAKFLEDSLPPDSCFNAVKISLDGRINSDLNWKNARQKALHYQQQNLLLFWEINLGLFPEPPLSLLDKFQFSCLALALEHFRDTLWKEFRHCTLGLSLYRGDACLTSTFLDNEEHRNAWNEWLQKSYFTPHQFSEETEIHIKTFEEISTLQLTQSEEGKQLLTIFSHHVLLDYLDLLASHLPDSLQLFLSLNVETLSDLWLESQLITSNAHERFHFIIKGTHLPYTTLSWGNQNSPFGSLSHEKLSDECMHSKPTLGVFIPQVARVQKNQNQKVRKLLQSLLDQKKPFRMIPEKWLMSEWDGLDELIIPSTELSLQNKRQLQGFCAAGGQVIYLENHHLENLFPQN